MNSEGGPVGTIRKSLLVSIVTYGGFERALAAAQCLLAAARAASIDTGIVIVDNFMRYSDEEKRRLLSTAAACDCSAHFIDEDISDSESPDPSAATFPAPARMLYVSPAGNLGYARAHNLAFRLGISGADYDAFLVTAPDVRMDTPGGLEVLLDTLAELPSAGVIGPKVVDETGRIQGPFRFQSAAARYGPLLIAPLLRMFTGTYFLSDRIENAGSGFVYRLMGCFMLFRKSAFELAGGFDERTFLYGEESMMAERLRAAGAGCYYRGDVTVLHESGASIAAHHAALDMLRMRYESDMRYYEDYRLASPLSLALARSGYFVFLKFWAPLSALFRRPRRRK